jgi:hypothetical protein
VRTVLHYALHYHSYVVGNTYTLETFKIAVIGMPNSAPAKNLMELPPARTSLLAGKSMIPSQKVCDITSGWLTLFLFLTEIQPHPPPWFYGGDPVICPFPSGFTIKLDYQHKIMFAQKIGAQWTHNALLPQNFFDDDGSAGFLFEAPWSLYKSNKEPTIIYTQSYD